MKLSLDGTKCNGYGECALVSPEMFELDEWGYAILRKGGEVPPEDEDRAAKAVAVCPAKAIVILQQTP